jgi:uncharacterized repeat protein (TIGR03809 family)
MSEKFVPRKPAEIARQLQSLAERRRQHLLELYRTGRWRKYYREDELMAQVRDSGRDIEWWGSRGSEQLSEAMPDKQARFVDDQSAAKPPTVVPAKAGTQ